MKRSVRNKTTGMRMLSALAVAAMLLGYVYEQRFTLNDHCGNDVTWQDTFCRSCGKRIRDQ